MTTLLPTRVSPVIVNSNDTTAGPAPAHSVYWLIRAFYGIVLATALVGQATGAEKLLGWNVWAAMFSVAAVELGGVVILAWSEYRRQIGEPALAARVLSALVAAGAVVFSWATHSDSPVKAGFFAGMSALGYLVWVLVAAGRRRDTLRAAGQLPPSAPVYGLFRWISHPFLTGRARAHALRDPSLKLYGSLAAIQLKDAERRRHAAITAALRVKFAGANDPITTAIAEHAFDLDTIARQLAEQADNAGLAALIAADLDPARLTGSTGNEDLVDEDGEPKQSEDPAIAAFREELDLIPETFGPVLPADLFRPENGPDLDLSADRPRPVSSPNLDRSRTAHRSDSGPDLDRSRTSRRTGTGPETDLPLDLVTAGRRVANRLVKAKKKLTRKALLDGLREANVKCSTDRASALLAHLIAQPSS